ncbi:MAG: hypothetical protein J6W09_07935 [Bacteroidales bacterium]|jgi:hypothetical protein|nr:hypothetical protein [Bacteroidales bacterium]
MRDWSEIGKGFMEALKAIWKGELVLRLRADKLFIHILYLFLIIGLSIYVSLMVDKTLTKVEKNKEVIKNLEVVHAQKTGELVKLHSISTTLQGLKELDSQVGMPEKPAYTIKAK